MEKIKNQNENKKILQKKTIWKTAAALWIAQYRAYTQHSFEYDYTPLVQFITHAPWRLVEGRCWCLFLWIVEKILLYN